MILVRFGSGPLDPVSPDRPPLDPSATHARQLLAHELAKAPYQAARPGWIDVLVQKIGDLFNSLFQNTGTGSPFGPNLIILIVVVVVIAAIVVAFLLFGLPRLNRRSAVSGSLFGAEDDRLADALRRDAERAAADGDYALAIAEGFRAIARGLEERAVISTFPGTTAHGFAVQAARSFPDFGADLARAADVFDGVRYLGGGGTEKEWQSISSLERGIRGATPVLELLDA
jgi:hypothetical protein